MFLNFYFFLKNQVFKIFTDWNSSKIITDAIEKSKKLFLSNFSWLGMFINFNIFIKNEVLDFFTDSNSSKIITYDIEKSKKYFEEISVG